MNTTPTTSTLGGSCAMTPVTCVELELIDGSPKFTPLLDTDFVRTTLESAAAKIAIELISQGKEHNVDISLMTIFRDIMDAMEAPLPLFCYMQSDHCMYKLIVTFTVPAKYANGPSNTTHTIIGEPCPSIQEAENATMMKAFEYLARVHNIAVMDYSSTLVEKYEDKSRSIYRRVNSVEYALEYMLQQWDESIKKVEKLNLALEKKMTCETEEAISKIFCDVGGHFISIVQRFKDSYFAAHEEYKRLEAESRDYVKASNEHYNPAWLQASRKKVWYNEKEVIDYLLSYLGARPANFINKLVERNSFESDIQMTLPKIPGVACGGITKITGTVESSVARSEEKAAAAAIRFLERHMKIHVIDLNHAERLNAKARKDTIKNLEGRFRTLGMNIKKEWSYMLACTRAAKELYGEHSTFRLSVPTVDQMNAFTFCSQEIDGIDFDCTSRYEGAVSKLDAMEKLPIYI